MQKHRLKKIHEKAGMVPCEHVCVCAAAVLLIKRTCP